MLAFDENEVAAAFASSEEIRAMYEELSAPIEVIAAEKGISTKTVEIILSQISSVYKAATPRSARKALFSEEDVQLAKETMLANMRYSELDSVKQRAAEFVIDEFSGRRDRDTGIPAGQLNITVINQTLNAANKALERSRKMKLLDNRALKSEKPAHESGEITTYQDVKDLVNIVKNGK
jgi:hypothetical protein